MQTESQTLTENLTLTGKSMVMYRIKKRQTGIENQTKIDLTTRTETTLIKTVRGEETDQTLAINRVINQTKTVVAGVIKTEAEEKMLPL